MKVFEKNNINRIGTKSLKNTKAILKENKQIINVSGPKELMPIHTISEIGSEHKQHDIPILEVIKLRKEFSRRKRKIVALNDISFNVYKGENLALLGANGAGKTTAVEIIAGISKKTSGQIKYNYKFKNSFHEGLGIQFQDSSYPEGLTCKDVIDFMLETYLVNISKKDLDEMIKVFGVTEFYKKRAKSLSGGQQQRLNILLSLLHKPNIVFLDELSTGLDIKVRSEIKHFIKEYATKNKITIILVSHDMAEVEELCNRVLIMQNGKIAEDMLMSEVIRRYGMVEKLAEKYI